MCAERESRLSISLFTVKRALSFDLFKQKATSRDERRTAILEKKEVERDKNFLINFIEYHTLFMIAKELARRGGEGERIFMKSRIYG